MAAIASGVDYLYDFFFCKSSTVYGSGRNSDGVLTCYVLLAFLWVVILGKFSYGDFSALVTAASYAHLCGLLVMSLKVHGSKSVAGLSSKTLVMYVLVLCFRLPSTTLKSGYNPVDATGDFVYQLVDVLSLLAVFHLLYVTHKTYRHTYQEDLDTLPLLPLVIPCILLGLYVKAGFNRNTLFDSCFAISLHLDTFVMVPQLWMLSKFGGKVDVCTCHYVAATVAANVMTFCWWYYCAGELEKRGPCLLATVILVEQVFKLLLSSDFMYYYAVSWLDGAPVVLPVQGETL